MDFALFSLALVIALGLIFEFVNGFHDAANAIATVVGTKALKPIQAVLMAAFFNLAGALSGTAVAVTIGSGLVDMKSATQMTIASGLFAAILWNLITWYYGRPSSSSHALIMGVVGAAVSTHGFPVILLPGLVKVGLGVIYSPLLAFLAASITMIALCKALGNRESEKTQNAFRKLQLLSSAWMAFSHGSNDGQKTMGIISLALFSYGALGSTFTVPFPVMVVCAIAIALGTGFGGWRIIDTMAHKFVPLTPTHGFVAETTAGTVIELASRLGVPISTTHAITGAIVGVGAECKFIGVCWGQIGTTILAWLLTFPVCFGLGYILMQVVQFLQIGG